MSGRAPTEEGGDRQRGQRYNTIRIPPVNSYHLETFNDNEKGGFYKWRDELDDGLGNVWLGLDKLLFDIRDDKVPMEKSRFDDLCIEHSLLSASSDPEDWKYEVIHRRVYTVIFAHIGPDARKIIAECSTKDGFEAYRLLAKSTTR